MYRTIPMWGVNIMEKKAREITKVAPSLYLVVVKHETGVTDTYMSRSAFVSEGELSHITKVVNSLLSNPESRDDTNVGIARKIGNVIAVAACLHPETTVRIDLMTHVLRSLEEICSNEPYLFSS